MLLRHPVLCAAAVSGCTMAAGDVLCQAIRARRAGRDIRRALRLQPLAASTAPCRPLDQHTACCFRAAPLHWPCCTGPAALLSRPAADRRRVDWRQTARFGAVGLTLHGPFFYNGFRWLDARFGPSGNLKMASLQGYWVVERSCCRRHAAANVRPHRALLCTRLALGSGPGVVGCHSIGGAGLVRALSRPRLNGGAVQPAGCNVCRL